MTTGGVAAAGGDQSHPTGGESAAGTGGDDDTACIVQLAAPAPPPASSLTTCPADPDGPPAMPRGSVTFVDAPLAPELEVELALTTEHQRHGLMFRPTLADHEGMLFSYDKEQILSFWMQNTCLALDLLFIQEDGVIAGILRQVPPWNEAPRRIACPSAHVLEVRAGFTEAYGILPGQKIAISAP